MSAHVYINGNTTAEEKLLGEDLGNYFNRVTHDASVDGNIKIVEIRGENNFSVPLNLTDIKTKRILYDFSGSYLKYRNIIDSEITAPSILDSVISATVELPDGQTLSVPVTINRRPDNFAILDLTSGY